LASSKAKDYKSLTNKAVFKFMDLIEMWYTFGQLNSRFNISVFGYAEYLNIIKGIYQSRSNRCLKSFKDADPLVGVLQVLRMTKGEKMLKYISM
jgi:hypothetical protein